MTVITGVIGMLGRFAGQILNTTLGWATLLLFGKVPQNRQMLLLVIVFGSLVWVALCIGVVLPWVGTLLVASVPLSNDVDPDWVRLGMLAGVIVVPLAIGIASATVGEGATKRSPRQLVSAALRGYPFAFAMALILCMLAAAGVVRKVRSISKKWSDAHIPMVVKPGAYDAVIDDLVQALGAADIDVSRHDAGSILSQPPKLLDLIAGRGLGTLVPERLMLLAGRDLEILVYPSDVAISGSRDNVTRARATLASRVSYAPAYLTTSAEAQKIEDLLDQIRDRARRDAPDVTLGLLAEVDKKLESLDVAYEEWQVLYRLRLQLERDARKAADAGETEPADAAAREGGLPSRARLAIGLGGTALVAVDIALQLAQLRDNGRGQGRGGGH